MIRTALEFIRKELEEYFVEREQNPGSYSLGNVVDLKPVVLPNGNINITDTSHITVMLINIEDERREGKRAHLIQQPDKTFLRLNPPLELELSILFVAHNSHYATALRDLSNVAGFFQSNPVFDSTKYPAMNKSVTDPENKPWQLIDRLSFRMHNLTYEQQNNLFAMMGAKYMPCTVYKAKLINVFETKAKEIAVPITELNVAENEIT